jgi:recombination protein RecA
MRKLGIGAEAKAANAKEAKEAASAAAAQAAADAKAAKAAAKSGPVLAVEPKLKAAVGE